MSRLTDLISQLAQTSPELAEDLRHETDVLASRTPFGLNFERHVPESIQIPARTIRLGDKVMRRASAGQVSQDREQIWIVVGFTGAGKKRVALLLPKSGESGDSAVRVPVRDLVVIAEFRDPIYPGLNSRGRVEQDPDKPFHVVVNGENYHVLEALTFACRHSVDCIYIDPPYNTRDKDWKYNNDYVDADDRYKHSKWLAMMERRLVLSKELLNPADSALVVTIDEKEYLRLGLLLEQVFPDAGIQMVTSVISAKGAVRPGRFSRVEEHIFFVLLGQARIRPWIRNMLNSHDGSSDGPGTSPDGDDEEEGVADAPEGDSSTEAELQAVQWLGLRRREPSSVRGSRPNQFFAIFVTPDTGAIHSVGDAIDDSVARNSIKAPRGTVALWPLKPDGTEMLWGLTPTAARKSVASGYMRVNSWKPDTHTGTVQYLPSGSIAKIEKGEAVVTGKRPDGSVEAKLASNVDPTTPPKRVWNLRSHNAETGGTKVLSALIPKRRFDYPKSLYAVEDTLRFVVGNKPKALVLDFFAGSGTTTHAVTRLNRQDGGRRRSICVTNNEVSAEEAGRLEQEGLRPGDEGWEKYGVFEYITRPRLTAALTGLSPDGEEIKGRYTTTDVFPMAEGFEENIEFFDLSYEDPELVRHGFGFEAIAALLWMRAGSQGDRITTDETRFAVTKSYAVLFDIDAVSDFVTALPSDVRVAFIVTDDEAQFQVVSAQLPSGLDTVRLYQAYLENFMSGGLS
ncbi:MAG TPA: DNA methyltransferase [Solirubrobacteraceae bacterium]|jgi:adenine-specific DNA-methyltransferase